VSDELTPEEVLTTEGEIHPVAREPDCKCLECAGTWTPKDGSNDSGHYEQCGFYLSPDFIAKRRDMRDKLAAVQIDSARIPTLMQRIRSRTLSTRSSIDIEVRANMAKEFLTAMLNSDGDKLDKVRVAVEYADLLLEELEVKS